MKNLPPWKGRYGRRDYAKAFGIIFGAPLFLLIGTHLVVHQIPVWLGYALLIICSLLLYIQVIRRLHDMSLSGWWLFLAVWLSIALVINVVFFVGLFFWPGTAGDNKYGPVPQLTSGRD